MGKETSTNAAPGAAADPHRPQEGIRETADSVIVAFILAFVFRAFVIEAFVIPTGSMAATLYGRHGTLVCSDCGWEFAYGLTDPQSAARGRELYGPTEVAVCPNCNHRTPITEMNDLKGNSEAGDRILALKWPYDIGGEWLGPRRWDVALFKDPSDSDLSDAVTNFIKRLVGLPNEVLEIIDGDIYAVPVAELSEETRQALEDARQVKHRRYTLLNPPGGQPLDPRELEARQTEVRQLETRLRSVWDPVLEELGRKLRICGKTPLAQKALWTVVYDHDFPPRSLAPDQPQWVKLDPGTNGWDITGRRLQFRGGDRYEGLTLAGKPITDRVSYNVRDPDDASGVTDLRLRFVCTPGDGPGLLLVRLPKRHRSFWAELNSDGRLRLYETNGSPPAGKTPLAEENVRPFEVGEPIVVDFQNVDYRASLSLNGRELLATKPEQFAPDVAALRRGTAGPDRASVQLFAEGWPLLLTHVVVERDVYYRSPRRLPSDRLPQLSSLTGAVWGGTGNPILLRDGEYFMLGDNSPASGDSRMWQYVGPHLAGRREDYQLGTVAADQLIGRAFFVYWPSGHRSPYIPILDRFGAIPNVGRMRWIR